MENRRMKAAFFLVLAATLLPLVLIPVISNSFHQIHRTPYVKNAQLELEGYDPLVQREIPLDGEWEYYDGRWIVTNPIPGDTPDKVVKVPFSWTGQKLARGELDFRGISSYRLLLKNCPGDVELLAYIPGISSCYRVFINGVLVSEKGERTFGSSCRIGYGKDYFNGIKISEGDDAELVVELAGYRFGGLYIAPILTDKVTDHFRRDIRALASAAVVGILLVTISCIACLFFMRDKTLPTLALLIMDLLVLLRIICQNGYLPQIQYLVAIQTFVVNVILQVVILFLPVVFLYCAKQLGQIQVSSKNIRRIAVYELLFSPVIFVCAMAGLPVLMVIFCVISYVPLLFIMRQLYVGVKNGVPYSLTVSAILLLIMSSMIMATVGASGLLVMDYSLFPPVCFSLSMLLQLWLYIRKNIEMQQQAVEMENLSLRLKESQTDLMLSQIKPHFLYNTLIAIHVLCTDAPETAAETTMKFANFLRTNMNFISSREPIPFEQELEHIKNYADIEKLRFQKRLTIIYDIQATDFLLPALTIQPLVENAIKYGACKNIQGGAVTLKTRKDGDCRIVEIIDNGPGFDVAILQTQSEEPHGIRNITFRLQEQMGAQIQINSIPGQGTTVRIVLPKGNSPKTPV